jgi:hypothetical protein
MPRFLDYFPGKSRQVFPINLGQTAWLMVRATGLIVLIGFGLLADGVLSLSTARQDFEIVGSFLLGLLLLLGAVCLSSKHIVQRRIAAFLATLGLWAAFAWYWQSSPDRMSLVDYYSLSIKHLVSGTESIAGVFFDLATVPALFLLTILIIVESGISILRKRK